MYQEFYQGDRQFFVPFLLGGLAGGAAVGLSRPRPIYNVVPQQGMYQPNGMPYYQSSYSYYQPIPRVYYY